MLLLAPPASLGFAVAGLAGAVTALAGMMALLLFLGGVIALGLLVWSAMTAASGLARNFQSSLNHLARLKGRAFDQAFKEQVIEDQQTSIRLFQEQAEHGTDPDLKAFAEKHLLQLRAQLALAERLDARTGDAQTDRESDGGTVNNVLRSLGTTPGGNIPR